MKPIGREAPFAIIEMRRHFREIKELVEGSAEADNVLSTRSMLRRIILSAMFAIALPIIIGLIFGPNDVVGLLIGCTIYTVGGFMMVIVANSGAIFTDTNQYMEAGNHNSDDLEGYADDAINDPFKDKYGQSISMLLKFSPIVSIVFAALVLSCYVFR